MQDAPVGQTETDMLAAKQAKMSALIGAIVHYQGVLGIVTRPYSPDCVNLIRLEGLLPVTNVVGFTVYAGSKFLCPVYWRHASGVQFVALVQRVGSGSELDLLVLSDGFVDLGSGSGVPVAKRDVPRTWDGGKHLEMWSDAMDPWVTEIVSDL